MDTPVDDAFHRCALLSRLIEQAREQATSNPTHGRYIDLGVTQSGDTRRDASRKLDEAFDDLQNLLSRVALLDMTRALEKRAAQRLDNALGDIRALVRDKYRSPGLFSVRERLVKAASDLQGLGALELLAKGFLSSEIESRIRIIRENRNQVAHGASEFPTVTAEEVRGALNALLDIVEGG